MEEVPKFVCKEWYRIKGVGWAAETWLDQDCPRRQPGEATFPHLERREVEINGERFRCVAVECHPHGGDRRKGERIGLVVESI